MKQKTFWLVAALLAQPFAAFAEGEPATPAPAAGHDAHHVHGGRK